MTKEIEIDQLIKALNLTVLTAPPMSPQISQGYCCDMLSWAMSRLEETCCWFTILNSMNVIAVAALASCPVIVLTEGVEMEPAVLARAQEENIAVLSTELSTFQAAYLLGKLLDEAL